MLAYLPRCAACPPGLVFPDYAGVRDHVVLVHRVDTTFEAAIRASVILPRGGTLAWVCQVRGCKL